MHFIPTFRWEFILYIFILFSCLALIQLLFTLLIQARFAFFKNSMPAEKLVPVSIVIAARNEADNIYKNLPLILTQDYPDFEVIIINHQSVDESAFLLNAYALEFPNLRIIEIEKNRHLKSGKKLPLTIGIKAAKYEHLLLTDADCKPASDQWLRKMAGAFSEKAEIVMGYGPYNKEKGLLNAWIRLETIWIAINYFSFALARMPYMAVGRNLGYTKTSFDKIGGFKKHYSLPSGDDDLFIQDAAKKKNYRIVADTDTFMYSEAKSSWPDYMQQKSRHLAASLHYKVIKKSLLGIYPLTLLLMLITFVILLWNDEYRWLSLAIFGFVTTVKWIVQGINFKKLEGKRFIWWFPVLDIVYVLVSTIVYYSIDKKAVKKWK